MDKQPKYKAQSESEFFADRSAMRQPVPGTVPADQIDEDPAFFTGIDQQGDTVAHSPLPVTMLSLERGRERFNIYCSPCHGRVGDGQGIMVSRGYVPPPSFHDDRIRVLSDGHIFDVITNGIRNMPAYRHQIPPEDRWAIVNYLRALQRSQHATMEDIPVERRGAIK
jgi:cytochrome c